MCIITAFKYDDGVVGLTKTRDRTYNPKVRFCCSEYSGVRTFFYLDLDTRWLEGMNEYGVTIVNSALMVTRDEKEHKKQKKGVRPSKDSKSMLKALTRPTLEESIESLLTHPVYGHSLITDGERLYHIEVTSRVPPIITELDPDLEHAYTNHGIQYPEEGYPLKTEDGKSSRVRRECAMRALRNKPPTGEALIREMKDFNIGGNRQHPYNMVRDTEKMKTSSLAFFHPKEQSIYFLPVLEKLDVVGDPYIPDGYDNPGFTVKLLS